MERDQVILLGARLPHPVCVEHVEGIRFLGGDGKECCYTLDQLKHQITVAEFWEGKPVFKETREQKITRAINTLMENGVTYVEMPGEHHSETIDELKFTVHSLSKTITAQREEIKEKGAEIDRLNAEIDRIAKESRHPGRYCCHIPCNKEAKYVVYFGAGHEDYTEVCEDHLAETIRDVEEYTVYPVQDPGEKGEDKEPELFICPDAEKCNVKDCRARTPHKWESGACEITNWCFSGQRSGPCVPAKEPTKEEIEIEIRKQVQEAIDLIPGARLVGEIKIEHILHKDPATPQEEVAAAEHIPVLYVKITNPSGDDVKEAGEVLKHLRWNFEIVRTNLRDCPGSKKEEK